MLVFNETLFVFLCSCTCKSLVPCSMLFVPSSLLFRFSSPSYFFLLPLLPFSSLLLYVLVSNFSWHIIYLLWIPPTSLLLVVCFIVLTYFAFPSISLLVFVCFIIICFIVPTYLFHHSCLFASCSHLLALCFHLLPSPLLWIVALVFLLQDSNFIFQVLAIAPTCFNAYMFELWCLRTSSLCFYFVYPSLLHRCGSSKCHLPLAFELLELVSCCPFLYFLFLSMIILFLCLNVCLYVCFVWLCMIHVFDCVFVWKHPFRVIINLCININACLYFCARFLNFFTIYTIHTNITLHFAPLILFCTMMRGQKSDWIFICFQTFFCVNYFSPFLCNCL